MDRCALSRYFVDDFWVALSQLAADMDALDLKKCAERFGSVALSVYAQGETRPWRFHPALGFSKVPT